MLNIIRKNQLLWQTYCKWHE